MGDLSLMLHISVVHTAHYVHQLLMTSHGHCPELSETEIMMDENLYRLKDKSPPGHRPNKFLETTTMLDYHLFTAGQLIHPLSFFVVTKRKG